MRAAPPYNKTAVIYNTIRVVGGGGGKRRKKVVRKERDVRCRGNDRGVIFYGRPHARWLEFCSVAFGLSFWKGLGRRLYVYQRGANRIWYFSAREKSWTTHAHTQSSSLRPSFSGRVSHLSLFERSQKGEREREMRHAREFLAAQYWPSFRRKHKSTTSTPPPKRIYFSNTEAKQKKSALTLFQ